MVIKSKNKYEISMDGEEFNALCLLIGKTSSGSRLELGLTDGEDQIISNIYKTMSNQREGICK